MVFADGAHQAAALFVALHDAVADELVGDHVEGGGLEVEQDLHGGQVFAGDARGDAFGCLPGCVGV